MYKLFSTKPKTPKNARKSGFSEIFYWVATLSAVLWLFWIILNPSQKGIAGRLFFDSLHSFFGASVYFLPFLLLYGIIAILLRLGKPNKGIITLGAGIVFFLTALSSILDFARYKTQSRVFDGGYLGHFTDTALITVFGDAGSLIFSVALLILSAQIIFKISWGRLAASSMNALKIDYKQWTMARNEFRNKLKTIKDNEDRKEKVYDIKPVSLGAAPAPEHETPAQKGKKPAEKQEPAVKQEPQRPPVQILNSINPFKTEKARPAKEEKPPIPGQFAHFKNFKLPSINLLSVVENQNAGPDSDEIQSSKQKLEETLKSFEISAYVSGVYPGPVITRYEVTPSPGVKISSIVSLSNDIALAMRAQGIRVIAPIPGKSAIGFEIPNANRAKVGLREILESPQFNQSRGHLTFALGRQAEGSVAVANLESMPHLLVGGATGSGKSVFLQALILSIIYRNTPDEVKFLFIDPKRLELTFYEGIPYLYDPKVTADRVSVITDAKEAAKSLIALTRVMEKRYKKFEKARVKNIAAYNKWAQVNNQPPEFYIVVVIDELADLMLQAKNVVEENIQRLAQMARAVGIHLVLATQRPSVDVITGVIKANLPSRVALQVTSKVDSRVIIDSPGADALIGKGDMLYLGIEQQKADRIQGCYVGEDEIEKISAFIKEQGAPNYPPLTEEEEMNTEGKGGSSEELVNALKLVVERRRVSQDLLKAHFGSSARATNILSLLEVKGFIHKPEGSNRWEIFFDRIEGFLSQHAGEVGKQ
ncbi:MAG: hypothetical protein COT17_05365 [Elusimicrobia bacterium CG08_land_8_20_14_0_20_51_18]|nr:MAG: hypothetical protein COT17_05365 [Elusimicrobia bacterium CG08_land_8_20_14_0_20_51_18]